VLDADMGGTTMEIIGVLVKWEDARVHVSMMRDRFGKRNVIVKRKGATSHEIL
jgi:hypothetical protein